MTITKCALAVVCLVALAAPRAVRAAELLTNGGFETGDFTGWTVTTDDTLGNGGWYVTGATSTPLNGFPTVGPASGTYYAVTDAFEPGSRALTQTFTDPLGTTSLTLSGDIFVNDWYGSSGAGVDVAILAGGADPLTGTPIAVLYSADTAVTAGVPNPWVPVNFDLTSLLLPATPTSLRSWKAIRAGRLMPALTISPLLPHRPQNPACYSRWRSFAVL